MNPEPTHSAALIWFRRDLRLGDNSALYYALTSARQVHAVFVFDTEILNALPEQADRRVEFIHASVAALKADLEARGGAMHVLHGAAQEQIPALAARLGVDAVFANRDYEPQARSRDAEVARRLESDGRHLHLSKDQVIFETDEVLTQDGRPYRVFTPYKRAWLAKLNPFFLAAYPVEKYFDRLARHSAQLMPTPMPTPMPTLAELGFQPTNLAEIGIESGESGAQTRWRDFQSRIDAYAERRNFPAIKGPSYLSVHLRFGTLSIRELARVAYANNSEGAKIWLSELIWREFYQMLLWHYPATVGHAFRAEFDALPWPNPPGHLQAWQEARTGYPIVDAAMRQLNQSGYMHNRLRMIVAAFLTKDLHVDWREGERYFAQKLIDYDQAANIGGWQWSASTGTDAQPWFRIFNPVTQSEKFDPQGKFIRRYVPELAKVPDKFIHAPWKMTLAQQQDCGVVLGRDYPLPMVDHAKAREITLALFKGCSASPKVWSEPDLENA